MSCLSHQVQAKAAFDHVLHSVLGKDNASALTRGLLKAGVDDICLLVNMEDSTISTLTYDRSEAEKDIPVPKGDKNLLQVFLDYVSHRNATIDPLSGDIGSWLHLSQASFDIFRLNPSYIAWRRVHGGKARSSSSKLSAVPGLATSKSCSQDDSKAQDCIPPLSLMLFLLMSLLVMTLLLNKGCSSVVFPLCVMGSCQGQLKM